MLLPGRYLSRSFGDETVDDRYPSEELDRFALKNLKEHVKPGDEQYVLYAFAVYKADTPAEGTMVLAAATNTPTTALSMKVTAGD